ncbi:hypothetical protein A5893_04545 [Pedobacter psychrophilus]|uniref:Uncharacterized protein n=1 Tax=Pedobacter psychrophilus TaxID=1826909 RepID=A0A179DI48_9SPHI|nr:hypothetical protein [Pedobacter psychrophilus]OAQ40229.1 hypothetical protein A5893_04545 [Pedobacter psychrophilus]
MKATIYSHKTIIGTVDLQVGDESMGCVYGEFLPNQNYYKDIQKFIWEFWDSKNLDYRKWNSLRFNARLENEYFLFPHGGYTFDDISDLPDEPIRIDIMGINIETLNFKNDTILEPWESITLEQKLAYEDELLKEITPIKSVFNFKNKDHHILLNSEISAFAKNGTNDDILFEIKKNDIENQFAIVHLTWTENESLKSNNYPKTSFYFDFNEFIQKKMKSDNIEWNL